MTASNQTYIFLPSPRSSNGISIPHSRSLVIARSIKPSVTNDFDQLITWGLQSFLTSSHGIRSSASELSLRKKCSVSLNSAGDPEILLTGLINSSGSNVDPQISHWSPRAPSAPHSVLGHVPSTYLSGRKRFSFGS